MVYRTSAVITVMSEDRIHSAELENRWEDLHNGSEDQKPTNKPEPPKRRRTTKPPNLQMICTYVLLVSVSMTRVMDDRCTFLQISPPIHSYEKFQILNSTLYFSIVDRLL